MTVSLIFLMIVVAIALLFDFINGFHDAANSIATVVSTRVLKPRTAVLWAAFFNMFAMLVFAPKVADTISKIVKIEPHDPVYLLVICSGLFGAIIWDLWTWWLGLPTSSSHALIGGLSGAALVYAGEESIRWEMVADIIKFIVLAPVIGFILGSLFFILVLRMLKNWRPSAVDRFFRKGQLLSAALYSIGHGANDAQKTMGVILAIFIAAGIFEPDIQLSLTDPRTFWIIFCCHLAIGLGTAFGGWRIVRTMGMRITKLRPVGGFCVESAGAFTLFLATTAGIPVSTTQTIAGSILGVGSVTTKFSNIKWGIATNILWAWLLTLPASGMIAAGCFYLINIT